MEVQNVVKEIIYPCGASIDLNNVSLGDKTLQPIETMVC